MNYRLKYLALLKEFNEHLCPVDKSIDQMTDEQYFLITELIKAGYLSGIEAPEKREGTIKKDIRGIAGTLNGRIFQETLEEDMKRRTVRGRLKALIPLFAAFLVGASTDLAGKVFDYFLKDSVCIVGNREAAKTDKTPSDEVKKP